VDMPIERSHGLTEEGKTVGLYATSIVDEGAFSALMLSAQGASRSLSPGSFGPGNSPRP